MLIESRKNPQVKDLIRLRERRAREKSGTFLIEGYRELTRAAAVVNVKRLYICQELFLGENENALIDDLKARGAAIVPCTAHVFQHISYRDRPDGLLAVAEKMDLTLSDLRECENPLYVLAEAIEKPGNLGTILRSSDAVGAAGLILCDRCTDLYNPNVVRASVGTLFTIPAVEADGEETLAFLKARNIQIVATTPSATALYTDVDLSGPCAIAMGTEQVGLSPRWMEAADIQVRIPMCGVADSLNVAMATTLLLYEALRQRG